MIASTGWAELILRLILGAIFIYHGHSKLFKNFKKTVKFVRDLKFRPALFWAMALGCTEFFGGMAVLVGLFTRIAAAALLIPMSIAAYLHIFKWKEPFKEGYEFNLLLLAALLALFLLGAGQFSLDSYIGWILG